MEIAHNSLWLEIEEDDENLEILRSFIGIKKIPFNSSFCYNNEET